MERKIGEIFEYNGEWYQTVEAPIDEHSCNGCQGCKGTGGPRIFGGECNGNARKDGKFVIFKKLEKVGKPYELNSHLVQKYRFFHNPAIQVNGICILETINTDKIIEIGIKQTKKDMEDLDKIKVRDYTKVEELNVMEEKKLNLKPFDIQKAREGKPVCTRDGRKARIICFDSKNDSQRPIIALITDNNRELLYEYTIEGKDDFALRTYSGTSDLMMLPERKEGWVNVYALNTCYSSKEEAEANIDQDYEHEYVRTVKIEWEE